MDRLGRDAGAVFCAAWLVFAGLAASSSPDRDTPKVDVAPVPAGPDVPSWGRESEALMAAGKACPGARVCDSAPHAILMRLAQEHAAAQARTHRMGHQGFNARAQVVSREGLGSASEICAVHSGLDGVSLESVGEAMFRLWRWSPAHWSVARREHRWYGAGMAQGTGGAWYACIITAD